MINFKISDRDFTKNVTEVTADRIDLSDRDSADISLNLSNSEISSMVRQGSDLVIYLANGEMIILADFYVENEDGKENRLLLVDQSGDSLDGLLPENYEYSEDGIFAQTVVVDDAATAAESATVLGVSPAVLATIGIIAGLVTIVSSADDTPAATTAEEEPTQDPAPVSETVSTRCYCRDRYQW